MLLDAGSTPAISTKKWLSEIIPGAILFSRIAVVSTVKVFSKHDLKFLYRLLLLTKDEDGFSAEDYKDRAFRDNIEEHADQLRKNMDLFNSYVCGGVELLYEKFKDCDDEDKIASTLYDLIREFAEDIGLEEGELPDFTPEYR